MPANNSTISAAVRNCFSLFAAARTAVDGTSADAQLAHQRSRFKIWSANIGAHQTGTRSLEYKLRDASNIRRTVLDLLQDLEQLLEDYFAIVRGEMTPWDELSDEGVEVVDEEAPATEVEQIKLHMKEVIDSLLGLSITIKNPAPHDRFMASAETDISFYEPHDFNHVRELYSALAPWQITRLGGAISRRRQYFRYRQTHHEKLAFGVNENYGDETERVAPSTFASSMPTALKNITLYTTSREDPAPQDYMSQTSFATSVSQAGRRRIPPLPREAADGPFECPFCYFIIVTPTRQEWKRHVFEDLRPYVCLQEDCVGTEYGFNHRRDWINHTRQHHLVEYSCPCEPCTLKFPALPKFKRHVEDCHTSELANYGMDALTSLALVEMERPVDLKCPFCGELQTAIKTHHRHVGRHMEELSLFALPQIGDEDAESSDEDEDEASSSSSGKNALGRQIPRPFQMDDLRLAAEAGNENAVARILSVNEIQDDPESMILAARKGHDSIIHLLLSIGGFNPDPAPLAKLPMESCTPMLAAIGQNNIKVVKLLLGQRGFDPQKRVMGQTYYEIARHRRGPHWQEEEGDLREAYLHHRRFDESDKDSTAGRTGLDTGEFKSEAYAEQGSRQEEGQPRQTIPVPVPESAGREGSVPHKIHIDSAATADDGNPQLDDGRPDLTEAPDVPTEIYELDATNELPVIQDSGKQRLDRQRAEE